MKGRPIRQLRRSVARKAVSALTSWAVRGGRDRIRKAGRILGLAHYRLTWLWQSRLRRDIARALDTDTARAGQILRTAFATNDRAVFEVLCMAHDNCSVEELLAHLDVQAVEVLEQHAAKNSGAVLLGMHMGNGILMASALARQGLPVHVVYRDPRRLTPGLLGRAIERGGAHPIELDRDNPTRSFRQMLKALRDGGLVYVLMDQANKGEGSPKLFLGKKMNMPNGVPGLAIRAGVPVFPIVAESEWPRWAFRVHEALPAESAETLLDAICASMESAVRSSPELWAWHHRRWKRYDFQED